MPIRKIPKNYRNITGIAPHNKAVGAAAYESSLERDFLILLAFNQDVQLTHRVRYRPDCVCRTVFCQKKAGWRNMK